jgi:hypothetical protein
MVLEFRVDNMAWSQDYRDNTTQLYTILKVSTWTKEHHRPAVQITRGEYLDYSMYLLV